MITQNEIIEAIAKHLGVTPQDIDMHATFAEDLGLGPIQVADLLSDLSETFNINFDPSETGGLKTVDDLVMIIEDLSLE